MLYLDCKEEPLYINFSIDYSQFFIVMACVFITLNIITAGYITHHREHPIIKGTSLIFNLLILLGCSTGFIGVFLLFGYPTTTKCTVFAYLSALSIALILCSLLIKTYRIYRIFAEPMKRRTGGGSLSMKVMLLRTFLIIAAEAVSLVVAGSISAPRVTDALVSNTDPYGASHLVCDESVPIVVVALLWNLAYLIGGAFLMYKTRRVRTDQFGESGWVIGILIVFGVIFPGTLIAVNGTTYGQILNVIHTGLTSMLALLMIFAPKVSASRFLAALI